MASNSATSRYRQSLAWLTSALLATALATPASAKQWTAVCSDLSGVRIDDSGAEPSFTPDGVKDASWVYSWNTDTKKATLALPASLASDGKSHKQEGVVSAYRGGFFVIVSSLPGAVWTHAIYPETGKLLSTQSTTKSGTRLSGRMLVGSCAISR
ncbi:hypothetical protein JNW90_35125 [Micromonospora sp. STR1s_5]|nr:hypothetical protein [Micromonospora sp. STR1s_5]